MAKKSKKVEKETRRLMEAIADLVKKKGDRYKFKSGSKKLVKKVKKTCPHWTIRKGKEIPVVSADPDNPANWKCRICQTSFPIRPATQEEYNAMCDNMLAYVNQLQFWSVKLGGDAEDTKMFIKLKENLPRMKKVSKQILKRVNQRQAYETNREHTDSLSQFGSYAGFTYRS